MMDIKGKKKKKKIWQRCQSKMSRGDRHLSSPSDKLVCLCAYTVASHYSVIPRGGCRDNCRADGGSKSLWQNL